MRETKGPQRVTFHKFEIWIVRIFQFQFVLFWFCKFVGTFKLESDNLSNKFSDLICFLILKFLNTHLSCQFHLLSALVYSLADFFKGNLSMSSTASELSASKVWVKDALQSFLPLSSSSILQSKPPSHHQSPSPSALVGLLENEKFLNPRYKTEICRNFKERSKCIYGDYIVYIFLLG